MSTIVVKPQFQIVGGLGKGRCPSRFGTPCNVLACFYMCPATRAEVASAITTAVTTATATAIVMLTAVMVTAVTMTATATVVAATATVVEKTTIN